MSEEVSWQKVVSVVPVGVAECVCISVADRSKLYATAAGILTHNTTVNEPSSMTREYVAVTGAIENLREGMKLVKSTEDERTIGGVRVSDTQYKTRSFEDMKPLAEAVVESWRSAGISGPDVLTMLRTGELGTQRLEPGERVLVLNSMFETGRFRDFGILQSDLSRIVQEVVGDSGFAMRAAQEILDPVVRMKAEADAEVAVEIRKVTGTSAPELMVSLGEAVNAEQVAELEKALSDLRKDNGTLRAQVDEATRERLQRAEEVTRLRNLLRLEEARAKELAGKPGSQAEADQRLADELVKQRAKIRELTKKLNEAETLFARTTEAPAATKALDVFNRWIMGEKIPGMPALERMAVKYLNLSRFDRDGFREGVKRLFPILNEDVIDMATDRIVEELEAAPRPKPEARTRNGGVVSEKGDVDKAEKTLRQMYEEDGAKRIAEAFFRGGEKKKGTKAPLGEGSALLNAELARVLGESLDALGIEHKKEKKNPQDVFRQVAVTLGLDNLREGKMREIDLQVRAQIAERAGESELAHDLIDQWEAISAGMLGAPLSGTLARRIARLILDEGGLSPADLAGMTDSQARQHAEAVGAEAARRVSTIESAGGVTPADIANVHSTMAGTVIAMVAKVRANRAAAEALRRSPAKMNERAAKIVDRLAADFSDTPTFGKRGTPDALRALVNEAMNAKEEMADLHERAVALGVSDEVASQLVSMVLEGRRRKDVVAAAQKASRLAEARRRAITRMIDKLEGKVPAKRHESLGKFLGSLTKASDWGILDADTFAQAFAHAFGLNGMTAARVAQLHALWHQLRNGGTYGMVRETLERQFQEAVNAVSPAARWDNSLFSAFMSKVLSSLSSVVNQFDGVTRILSPLSAVTNALYTSDPGAIIGNYAQGLSRLAKGLPFWLTGVKGESLGHLPAEIGPGYKPGEMQLSRTTAGRFRVRLPGGRVVQLSPTTTQVLRWMELYSWRLIRGAEGLVGSAADARSSYQDALALYYQGKGMKAAEARHQALRDIAAGPADISAAMAQAAQEQTSGLIGGGAHVLQRRAEEIIQHMIDNRLGADIAKQAEQFTAYMNFKTDPLGPIGHIATQIVKLFIPTNADGTPGGIGRVTRFWLMFPRFFGNLVDRSIGYVPGLHLLNLVSTPGHNGTEAKILEVFGTKENYNRFQHARAGAGGAMMVMAAALLALSKALRDDDDEEPWFNLTGSLPSSSREEKARLKAAGKWSETTLKIGSVRLNYSSFGELSPVLTFIGNVNDYLTHGDAAGEHTPEGAGFQVVLDTTMAPVRRSTYRQWLQLVSNMSGGANAQQGEQGIRGAAALLVQPLGGLAKIPLVTDLDRLYRGDEVRVTKTLADKALSKIPFVKVGNALITPYGERVQGMPFLGILGEDLTDNADVLRAARLNLDTGSLRAIPTAPEVAASDSEAVAYQELAGKLYTSGLVKNEAKIREKLEAGDMDEVKYILRAVASMANASAKAQMWPGVYGADAKKEAMKAAAEERKEDRRERKNAAAESGTTYILPP